MKTDLSWLVGQQLSDVNRYEHSWSFVFRSGDSLSTYTLWRLIGGDKIVVTSQDDGHPFGLGAPVDARERALSSLHGIEVVRVSIADIVSDLILHFANQCQLQLLNTSCGYESWTAYHKPYNFICMGGGGLSVWNEDKEAAEQVSGGNGA